MIGTAYANGIDVSAVLQLCHQQLGSQKPDLLLAFVGGKHEPQAALAALRNTFGDVPIVGGSTAGAIAPSGFGYSGFEIGLVAFSGAEATPRIVVTRGLLEGEQAAGYALGKAVRESSEDGAVTMLLFDSVASSAPLRLHPASRIMMGFQEGLDGRFLHVIGGGLLTDINLSDGWIFDGHDICKHAMTALVFPLSLESTTVILHGCRPVSTFMEITRMDGSEVLELDGQPALSVVEQMLGIELGTTSGQQLSLVATLGEKQGDPYAPYDENNYVNRLILRADPVARSITLFEPDFGVGTRVQIMSRDNPLMLDSVERGVAELKRRIVGKRCALGLYIDCAGRASVVTGASPEEADLVLRSLQPDFPFMGFYSGVEIAPFAGDYSRPLDWTGVLTILHHS
jgi:hypothetical protein